MSLTDPDARSKRRASLRLPLVWALAILGQASSPILVAIVDSSNPANVNFELVFLTYLALSVGSGIWLYHTTPHRNPVGLAAFVFSYLGGLVLLLGAAVNKQTGLPAGLPPALIAYGIAVVLIIIFIVHTRIAHATIADGVTTTATVTAAGINGMVNYVQHWKLTLKFTDSQGTDRWFHIGRTGQSYSVGQQFQIKYNPKNPGSRLGIVVLDG
jgi:peptidoglycan/LPS O-acetylase OafA/YrhL